MVINRKNVLKIQWNICCISTNFGTYVSAKNILIFTRKFAIIKIKKAANIFPQKAEKMPKSP